MKKLFAITAIIITLFTLVGCNNTETDKEKVPEFNPAETVVTYKPDDIKINNYTVTNYGEIKYNPYNDDEQSPTVIIYFNFTNNSKSAVAPSDVLTISAKQGKNNLKTYEYAKEYAPFEQSNLKNKCNPGESVICCYSILYNNEKDDIKYEIKDKNNKAKEKLIGTIKISNLVFVKENLCQETATVIEE